MSCESLFAVSSANFPKFDRLVSRARNNTITFRSKIDIGYVMVMAEESLKAEIVIVQIPELDRQIGRA